MLVRRGRHPSLNDESLVGESLALRGHQKGDDNCCRVSSISAGPVQAKQGIANLMNDILIYSSQRLKMEEKRYAYFAFSSLQAFD